MRNRQNAITLIEVAIVVAVIGILAMLTSKAVKVVQSFFLEQLCLSQLIEVQALNNDITTHVRSAKRIVDIQNDRLVLEVYDYEHYPDKYDKRALTNTRRLVYIFSDTGGGTRILEQEYDDMTPGAAISRTREYGRAMTLWPPATADQGYFEAMYTDGTGPINTVAIHITLRKPFFRSQWIPIPAEASVYASGL
jgi:prepilin-type N-terminal cleavage/methylation domain-containing protein